MSLEYFHPITAQWFTEKFGAPSLPQQQGWPLIAQGKNTLIAAPTGSGKTLAAFLVCIDRLVQEGMADTLRDECKVLYLSPLKALASDVRKNLELPLEEIVERVKKTGFQLPEIRSKVRTGDTPPHERQSIVNKPPHILVTTPESLYLMLTSEKGRHALRTVETVIVDEIHALARDKRGSHLALSLERLKGITERKPTMIGLSATQKPIEEIAAFLVGNQAECRTVDVGHGRALDLGLYLPESPLSSLCSGEQWEEIYQNLAQEIRNHRSTVVFVNTRRMAERVAFRLAEILGEDQILSHHGSLSKNRRIRAETLLKEGRLKAIVATASLELGIDIGYIDLVCQIGIPFSIATFLQRVGRSGHALKATPKGRILPLTRDELLEAYALIHAVRRGKLDKIEIPEAPLDILAQQLIAECAARGPEPGMTLDEGYRWVTGAYPYRGLTKEKFVEVVKMASEGFAPGRRKYAYLIWDRVRDRLSTKAGARMAAITSGGAIPEMGDYKVVLEDDGTVVGSVNEDFAIESLPGDIFLLGTHSWRIRHVRGDQVVVSDAEGQPPSIPFWLGESPGRTKEFSISVSTVRTEIERRIPDGLDSHPVLALETISQLRELPTTPFDDAIAWLREATETTDRWGFLQAVHYLTVQKYALGLIPSREKIVFERFFDETGGMQLVIHSVYGARINRAWGLALRKRFCRTFDFELQASADDDGIILSLGPQQSFPIEQLFKMLNPENVEPVLVQALLAAPMFGARWRWNATRALAVLRSFGGKRVAPALQRFRSEDLLTAVFPAQTACQENAPGDKEIPDHALVKETIKDCLFEAMDIDGFRGLLVDIAEGRVTLIPRDTREPSPFAYQLISAFPYAFLDDAPAEDRRTRAVQMRPALALQDLQDLDRMDPSAIHEVTTQAWPDPRSADELYEVLMVTPAFPWAMAERFQPFVRDLLAQGRAAQARGSQDGKEFNFLVAAENIALVGAAYDAVTWSQSIRFAGFSPEVPERADARQSILKGWLEISGPFATTELAELFALTDPAVYLGAVEANGSVLQCRLEREAGYTHWCSRALLRRVHRLTVDHLREQIRPVTPADYLEFIFEEHGLNLATKLETSARPADDLLSVLQKLQGFEAPALAWERELLASRLASYDSGVLDQLTSRGTVAFGRLTPKKNASSSARAQAMNSVVPLSFGLRKDWPWLVVEDEPGEAPVATARLSSAARQVWEVLQKSGAQFVDEILAETRLLETQAEGALAELAAEGLVTSDQFQAFRIILRGAKSDRAARKKKLTAALGGRWSILKRSPKERETHTEKWAALLLSRYGIVFRDLLNRETLAPSWGELVRVFRRLEARGEVRGGRFITGVSGEQFGLAETHEKLVRMRKERGEGKRREGFAIICSSDPLNLIGIVTKGEKIPSHSATRLLFENGELTAVLKSNELNRLKDVSEERLRCLRLVGTLRRSAAEALGPPPLLKLVVANSGSSELLIPDNRARPNAGRRSADHFSPTSLE